MTNHIQAVCVRVCLPLSHSTSCLQSTSEKLNEQGGSINTGLRKSVNELKVSERNRHQAAEALTHTAGCLMTMKLSCLAPPNGEVTPSLSLSLFKNSSMTAPPPKLSVYTHFGKPWHAMYYSGHLHTHTHAHAVYICNVRHVLCFYTSMCVWRTYDSSVRPRWEPHC